MIRHLLRKRFGENRSDAELWERCTDWLRAEGRLTPNDYLPLPLNYLQWLLEHGFYWDQTAGNEKLAALQAFQARIGKLELLQLPKRNRLRGRGRANRASFACSRCRLAASLRRGVADAGTGTFACFLKLARNDDEAAEGKAELLLQWVNGEIESHRADEQPSGGDSTEPRVKAGDASSATENDPDAKAALHRTRAA